MIGQARVSGQRDLEPGMDDMQLRILRENGCSMSLLAGAPVNSGESS